MSDSGEPRDILGFRGKTVWTWMELLVAPLLIGLVIGLLAAWFQISTNNSAQEKESTRADLQRGTLEKIAELQDKREDGRADLQRELEDGLNQRQQDTLERIAILQSESDDLRSQTQQQLEEDRAKQDVLQSFMEDMTALLLGNDLAISAPEDVVRQIARSNTLTAVRQLDDARKGLLLRFLFESKLIVENPIILLNGADLSKADLRGADLRGADLSNVNLSNAKLQRAILRNANLTGADLTGADLTGADLTDAGMTNAILSASDLSFVTLSGADLSDADLRGADLDSADLNDTDLRNTNLTRAIVTDAQLTQAFTNQTRATPVPTTDFACFNEYFEEDPRVPPARLGVVAVGTRDFDIIEPPQENRGIFGVKFTDVGQTPSGFGILPIGGIKIMSIPENEIFRIVSVVDATCAKIGEFSNVDRKVKDTLQNYDTLEIGLGKDVYNLRLGLDGNSIGINLFIKLS